MFEALLIFVSNQRSIAGNHEEIYKEIDLGHMHIWLGNLDFQEIGEKLPWSLRDVVLEGGLKNNVHEKSS